MSEVKENTDKSEVSLDDSISEDGLVVDPTDDIESQENSKEEGEIDEEGVDQEEPANHEDDTDNKFVVFDSEDEEEDPIDVKASAADTQSKEEEQENYRNHGTDDIDEENEESVKEELDVQDNTDEKHYKTENNKEQTSIDDVEEVDENPKEISITDVEVKNGEAGNNDSEVLKETKMDNSVQIDDVSVDYSEEKTISNLNDSTEELADKNQISEQPLETESTTSKQPTVLNSDIPPPLPPKVNMKLLPDVPNGNEMTQQAYEIPEYDTGKEKDVEIKEEEVLKPIYKYFKNTRKANELKEKTKNFIFALAVVDFDHIKGPELTNWIDNDVINSFNESNNYTEVEKSKIEKFSKIWPYLPFQALPDGAHMFDETFAQFTLSYDELNECSVKLVKDKIDIIYDSLNLEKNDEDNTTDDEFENIDLSQDKSSILPKRQIIKEEDPYSGAVTLFGCACIRQVESKLLKLGNDDTKRSIVQKSIVLITRAPIPIQLREKLSIITQSWFEQYDFKDDQILYDLFNNISNVYNKNGFIIEDDDLYEKSNNLNKEYNEDEVKIIKESDLYMSLNFQDTVLKLRRNLLTIIKCLITGEFKILVFSKNLNDLSNIQYSLIGLIPNLMLNLIDSGHPLLDSYLILNKDKIKSLKSSDRSSILQFLGFPLHLFGNGSFFQPYLSLQEFDYITNPNTKSFLIGSSNDIILENKKDYFDMIIYLDEKDNSLFSSGGCKVEIINKLIKDKVGLTWDDKKFIDFVIQSVEIYKQEETTGLDEGENNNQSKTVNFNTSIDNGNYKGGDDFIRSQFEDYLIGFLSCIKYDSFLEYKMNKGETREKIVEEFKLDNFSNDINKFYLKYVDLFKMNKVYSEWNSITEDELFSFFEPKHISKDILKNEKNEGVFKGGEIFKDWIGKWKEVKPETHEVDKVEDNEFESISNTEDNKSEIKSDSKSIVTTGTNVSATIDDKTKETVQNVKVAMSHFGRDVGSFFKKIGENTSATFAGYKGASLDTADTQKEEGSVVEKEQDVGKSDDRVDDKVNGSNADQEGTEVEDDGETVKEGGKNTVVLETDVKTASVSTEPVMNRLRGLFQRSTSPPS